MKSIYITLVGAFFLICSQAGEYDVPVKFVLDTDEYYDNVNNTIVTKYLNSCSILITPQSDVFLLPLLVNEEFIVPVDNFTIPTFTGTKKNSNWDISFYEDNVDEYKNLSFTSCLTRRSLEQMSSVQIRTTNEYEERQTVFDKIPQGSNYKLEIHRSDGLQDFTVRLVSSVELYIEINFHPSNLDVLFSGYSKQYYSINHADHVYITVINGILYLYLYKDTVLEFDTYFHLPEDHKVPFEEIKHFASLSGVYRYKLITPIDDVVLNSVEKLTSPWLDLQNNSCFSILVYKLLEQKINVSLRQINDDEIIELETLEFIQAENESVFSMTHLEDLNSDNIDLDSVSVTLIQVKVQFPSNWNQLKKLTINLDRNVNVKFIWQCPSNEFFLSKTTQKSCWKMNLNANIINKFVVFTKSPSLNEKIECLNGGVFIKSGCVCPPGFVGEHCEISCGRNKYGKDCLQKCSGQGRSCKGFILCIPHLGCSCAPGYKGEQCLETCDQGFYGADCTQKCGNCKGSCNSITGYCMERCKTPYFIAPFCKNSHSYFKQGAIILTSSFDKIKLRVNVSEDNIERFEDKPSFYMVQYKVQEEKYWKNTSLKVLNSKQTDTEVEKLNSGDKYEFRVILFDETLQTHDPDQAKITVGETKCITRNETKLLLTVTSVSSSAVIINWEEQDELSKEQCKSIGYIVEIRNVMADMKLREIKMGKMYKIKIEDLLEDTAYKISVRIFTTKGEVKTDSSVKIKTKREVNDLNDSISVFTVSKSTKNVSIRWIPNSNDLSIVTYYVKYKLEKRLACNSDETNSSLRTAKTSLNTFDLSVEPFSLYKIFVTLNKYQNDSDNFIHVTTNPDIPRLAPAGVKLLKSSQTEAHLRIIPSSTECTSLNGIFQSYRISMFSDLKFIRHEDFTSNDIVLTDLLPSTHYNIRVNYVNHVGEAQTIIPLIFDLKTKSSESLFVKELASYKTSQNMIGLRWKMPNTTTAVLGVKIELTGQMENKTMNISEVESFKCNAWPNYYCFEITHLKFNRSYTIAMTVLSEEYPEGDQFETVTAITRETISSPVDNISFVEVTENSAVIQWNIPFMLNGILRKFTIEIEQISAFDENLCCQSTSIITYVIHEEKETYSQLINNLQNSSTYQITIKPFTRKPGKMNLKVFHTTPPLIPVSVPTISVLDNFLVAFNTNDSMTRNLPEQYNQLIDDRLIIVLPSSTTVTQNEPISAINNVINSLLNTTNWWLAHVCLKKDNCTANIGIDTEMDSAYGKVMNKALEIDQNYSIAVIQINKYESALSYSMIKSESFQTPQNQAPLSVSPVSTLYTTELSTIVTSDNEGEWTTSAYLEPNNLINHKEVDNAYEIYDTY